MQSSLRLLTSLTRAIDPHVYGIPFHGPQYVPHRLVKFLTKDFLFTRRILLEF